jgi:hypothetical protein
VSGYIRATTDEQVASPDMQKQIFNEYAARLAKTVKSFYFDPPRSGEMNLCERDAGGAPTVKARDCGDVVFEAIPFDRSSLHIGPNRASIAPSNCKILRRFQLSPGNSSSSW